MELLPLSKRFLGYRCVACSSLQQDVDYLCPTCGANTSAIMDTAYLRSQDLFHGVPASLHHTLWRYANLLPFADLLGISHLSLGQSPLYDISTLAKTAGVQKIYIKDDTRNPSGSYKDRASVMVLKMARDKGKKVITCASTGNAASSVACLGASQGFPVVIFVPRLASRNKINQLLVFGATLFLVDGTYHEAVQLSFQAAQEFGWYSRNSGVNPMTREGKKTAALEIVEQLGGKLPDHVFAPAGTGNTVSALWKGFNEMYELGLCDRLPKLSAVQTTAVNPLVRAYQSGEPIQTVYGDTVADSINVPYPKDGFDALNAVRASGGAVYGISDEEIIATMSEVSRASGVFAEPAAAATYAGLRHARAAGKVGASESVLLVFTGNGLKDDKAVGKMPHTIAGEVASYSDVQHLIAQRPELRK